MEFKINYQQLVETISCIIIGINEKGMITFFNRFSEELFGYSREEVAGEPFVGKILPEKDSQGKDNSELIAKIIQDPGRDDRIESKALTKTGKEVWFCWSVRSIKDGQTVQLLIEGNDSSELHQQRERAESAYQIIENSPDMIARLDVQKRLEEILHREQQQLRMSEDHLKSVLNNSMDASYRRDLRKDTYDYVSPVISRITGIPVEEFAAFSIADICNRIHPEDVERFQEELAQIMESDIPSGSLEYRFRAKNGEYIWVGDNVVIIRDEKGDPIYRVGNFRDINGVKNIEEKLRVSEERLRFALTAADIGIWDLDLITDTAERSLEHDKIWGYAEMQPKWGYEIAMRHVLSEDRPIFEEAFSRAEETGLLSCKVRVCWPDGSIHWISPKGRVYYDNQGRPKRMIGVVMDITERKKAKMELERSNKDLEQFAYAVSHDLQEPLRSIVSFLQLLQLHLGDQLDEKGQEYLERTVAAGRRMKIMIEDFLSLSRVTTRQNKFITTNIDHLVKRVVDDLRTALDEKHADVYCEQLPTLSVDASQIQSLFRNLISNSIKYNKSSHPKIEIGCSPYANGYQFYVKDNGIGFSPMFRERVFKLFQRLHTDSEYPGTGIGLALCQKIVERHGGQIWVEPLPGKGSTFYFTFPKNR